MLSREGESPERDVKNPASVGALTGQSDQTGVAMTDTEKIATEEDGHNPPDSWEEKRKIAAGFFEPARIAERRRRREEGEPLLHIVDEGQDREEAA